MATETRQLRIQARKMGATNVREMSRDELKDYIKENKNGSSSKNGKGSAKLAKKAVKAAKVKRGPGRPRKEEVAEEPKRRGRPPGTKNKKNTTAVKRGRPAKSESRKSTKRSNGVGRPVGSGTGTRVALSERINWNRDFDFRDGTTQNYILAAIRKASKKYKDTSDIREDVFERLVDKIGDVDELTFNNRSTGKPHKGTAAENRLKYYISRTMFDYAVNTGQHEGSGESNASQPRNGNGATKKKNAKGTVKRGRPRKVVEDDDDDDDDDEEEVAPRKRGRPKGTTNKKRGPGRPKGSTTKATKVEKPRRGRPPGSKNKGTAKAKTSGKRGPGRPKGSKNKK